jgi:multicomponent Na+:H+ antiporter subunit D
MTLAAFLCVYIGSYPWTLYAVLPFPLDYQPFDSTHVIAQLQLLFFSALAFAWLKLSGIYPPELHSVNLDAEWTYRKLLPDVANYCVETGRNARRLFYRNVLPQFRALSTLVHQYHSPSGGLARSWPTSGVALVALIVFALILIINYF